MKRLYGDNDRYLPEAIEISHETGQIIGPLMKEWGFEKGYSVRDISNVIRAEIALIEAEMILSSAAKRKRNADLHTVNKSE